MRLSEILAALASSGGSPGSAGRDALAIFPEIAMVLFLAIFTGVVLHALHFSRSSAAERVRALPLADDAGPEPPRPQTRTGTTGGAGVGSRGGGRHG